MNDLSRPPGCEYSLEDVSSDAARARLVLAGAAQGLRFAAKMNTFLRVVLGRQLQVIRDESLWADAALHVNGSPPHNWDEWLSNDFAAITGYDRTTGYGALKLARSETLQALSEERLKELPLQSAFTVATIERRNGKPLDDGLVEMAFERTAKEFRRSVGESPERGRVETVTFNQRQAAALEDILAKLKDADPDRLEELQTLFVYDLPPRCPSPDDFADFLIASIQHELGSQE